MKTSKQELGTFGENFVIKTCSCPKCKRKNTFKLLPPNFKCADLICDYCGFLAQVKTTSRKNCEILPPTILGAAWGPQKERMDSGIYFPLFIVLVETPRKKAIYYLSSDLQEPKMFIPRKPLSKNAKRAGWQGFMYDLSKIKGRVIRLR